MERERDDVRVLVSGEHDLCGRSWGGLCDTHAHTVGKTFSQLPSICINGGWEAKTGWTEVMTGVGLRLRDVLLYNSANNHMLMGQRHNKGVGLHTRHALDACFVVFPRN